jgi:hypothetical protein
MGERAKMNNVSFGEKAYSAAKISAVLDALVAEGVSPVGASAFTFDADFQKSADTVLSKRGGALARSSPAVHDRF